MRTLQDIFAEKIEDVHLTEPWTLLEDNTLQVHVLKSGQNEFVYHRAFGRFQCSQCFRNWSSAKVHILFHMRLHQGQGMVWMRTFRQACRRCPNPQLEEAEFSEENVEKIMRYLVLMILKYFYKVSVPDSDLLEVVVDAPVMGPHDSARCEGCQLGVCRKSRSDPSSDAQKSLKDAAKSRTHHTLKDRYKRLHANTSHHSSLSKRNFPWKRWCCIGSSLFCVLAVVLFIALYLTLK